jgi:hypothetical protein
VILAIKRQTANEKPKRAISAGLNVVYARRYSSSAPAYASTGAH